MADKLTRLSQLKLSLLKSKSNMLNKIGNIAGTVAEVLTDLQDQIDGLEVGGTQLLRGTNTVTALTSTGKWSAGTWRRASAASDSTGNTRTSIVVNDAPNANIKVGWEIKRNGTSSIDIAQDAVPVTVGQTYTLSAYAKGTGALRLQYGKSPYPSKQYTLSNVTRWTRYSYTFTIGAQSDGSTDGSTNIYIGAGANGTIQICGMKLETGNKAHDWSPAPEDWQKQIDGKAGSGHKQAHTAEECTTYTSDVNTMGVTPAAVKKAITEVFEPKSHTHSAATQSTSGYMSAADKKKLDGMSANANNYAHPTAAGSKHIPAGGSSGQILRWSADGTAAWGADNNTTYSAFKAATSSAAGGTGLVPAPAAGANGKYLRGDGSWQTPPNTTYNNMSGATGSAAGKAGLVPAPAAGANTKYLRGDGTWQTPPNTTYGAATQSAAGLMSAADKKKMDGIAANANNYKHPSTHPASMIELDATHRFVSDTEKNTWNNKLDKSGGTITGNLTVEKAMYVHVANGTSGTAGYVKIAQLKVTKTYQNVPIVMELFQRGADCSMTLYIRFESVNTTDPTVQIFRYFGSNYGAYLVKAGASTWDLYVKKSEAYDSIGVGRYNTNGVYMDGVSVTWTNVQATSVPAGYIQAVAETCDLNASYAKSASEIVDYANASGRVKATWKEASATTAEYFAVYDPSSSNALAKIKTMSVATVKKILGVIDPPKATAVTIPTSGWGSDSDPDYPKYYDIPVSGITVNDRASIDFPKSSEALVKACGMWHTNETMAGKIRIRAKRVPTAAIAAQYRIEKGKG